MMEAFKLGGQFAAHAIWLVSDDPFMFPTLAFNGQDGKTVMERLIANDAAEAVEIGKGRLERNDMKADVAALTFDGRIPLADRKYDAIIVEMRSYDHPGARATIAVPYTPAVKRKFLSKGSPFRVHRPKLIEWTNCDQFDVNATLQAFWDGIDVHKPGAKVWNDALDESV